MRKGSCVACLVGALRTTDFRVHSSRHQLQLWYSYSTFQGPHVRLPRYLFIYLFLQFLADT